MIQLHAESLIQSLRKKSPEFWHPIGWQLPPSAIVLSGLVCAPEGIFEDVIPNSPAAEAGVLKGDRLLEINGVSVQSLKFWKIKHAFRAEPETRVTLHLQASGEAPREVTLIPRDLL